MSASSSAASPARKHGKLILSPAEYRRHYDNIMSLLEANPGSILLRHSESQPGKLVVMRFDDDSKEVLHYLKNTLNDIDELINPQQIIFLNSDNELKLMKLEFESSFLLKLFHKAKAMKLIVSFTLSTAGDDILFVRKSRSQQGFLTVSYKDDKYMIGANACESRIRWYSVSSAESPTIYRNKIELDENSVTKISELAKILELVKSHQKKPLVLDDSVKIACFIDEQIVYFTYSQIKAYQHQLLVEQHSAAYLKSTSSLTSRYTTFGAVEGSVEDSAAIILSPPV